MNSAATDHQSFSTEPLWFESPGRSDGPIRIGDFRITVESHAMPGVGRIAAVSPVVLVAATLSSGALATGWLAGHGSGSIPATERLPVHSGLVAEPRFAGPPEIGGGRALSASEPLGLKVDGTTVRQTALAVETEMAARNNVRTAARTAALKAVAVKTSANRADNAGGAGSDATPHPTGAPHDRSPNVKTVAPGLGTSLAAAAPGPALKTSPEAAQPQRRTLAHPALAHSTSAGPDLRSPSFEDPIASAPLAFTRLEWPRRPWRWDSSTHFHHNRPTPTTPVAPVDPVGPNGTTDPSTTDPGTTDQGTTDPSTTDPGTTDQGTTDPSTTDPGTTDQGTTDPSTTDPGTTDQGTTDPSTTDPGTANQGTTDPEITTARGDALAGTAEGSVSIGATPPPQDPASMFFTQTGGGTGASCSSALSATQFNAATFPAGITVGLCGTITSTLTPHGAGTDSHPVTVEFEPGSSISQPFCNPCMSITGQSYMIIDGNHVGAVQSSANGTVFANRQPALGIYLQNTSHVVIDDLTIQDLYVHSSSSDTTLSSKSQYAIEDYNGNNNEITGNTIHDTQVGIYYRTDGGYGINNEVDHNEFYNIDNPVNQTYSFAGGSTGPFLFDHNHLYGFSNWDTSGCPHSCAYHHDGLHCYTSDAGAGPAHLDGMYFYDNRVDGNYGTGMNSPVFIEGLSSTPCADSSSPIYIFNNVFISNSGSYNLADGLVNVSSGAPHVLNNTFVGVASTTGDNGVGITLGNGPTGSEDIRNNVYTGTDQLVNDSALVTFSALDYNVYAADGGATNAFVCGSNFYSIAQLASWQTCSSGDTHSTASTLAKLNSDGSPQAGSPALSAGTNLTSLCSGTLAALCQDINGNPRPSSGSWDAGAAN